MTFKAESDADAAINAMHEKVRESRTSPSLWGILLLRLKADFFFFLLSQELDGRVISVNKARPRQQQGGRQN